MCSKYRKDYKIREQLNFIKYNLDTANYNLINSIHYNNISLSNILARFKQLHNISLAYRKIINSGLNNNNSMLSLIEKYYEHNFLYNLDIERIIKLNDYSYKIDSSNTHILHNDDFILLHYIIYRVDNYYDLKLLYYNFIQILKMFALHNINITNVGNDMINYFDLDKTIGSTDNEDFF